MIGGPGAFVIPAASFETFADAILKKLVIEISDAAGATLPLPFFGRGWGEGRHERRSQLLPLTLTLSRAEDGFQPVMGRGDRSRSRREFARQRGD